MNEQPEALRLADILQHKLPSVHCLEVAAAELRRLHEENERLRKTAMLTLCTLSCTYEIKHAVKAEREACAKVCEEIPLPEEATSLTHLPTIERCAAAIRARGET